MSGRSDQKERRMIMLQNMWMTFITEKSLFIKLFVEHVEISLIAIVLGGVVGILISEFERSAKLTLGVINFLYTIPSISMLGFLIPFSGVGNATAVIALLALVMDLILGL